MALISRLKRWFLNNFFGCASCGYNSEELLPGRYFDTPRNGDNGRIGFFDIVDKCYQDAEERRKQAEEARIRAAKGE